MHWEAMTKWMAFGVLVLTAGLCFASPARACLHANAKHYTRTITTTQRFELSQKGQHGLIFHDGQRQDLIMAFEVSATAPLDSLAWIVPVPAVPDRFDTASAALLGDVAKWTSVRRVVVRKQKIAVKARGMGKATQRGAKPKVLEILPPAEAGPYVIVPLKATGDAGVEALRDWMKTNGFVPLEKDKLSYYVERKWTFLAVKIAPKKGEKAISDKGLLPPLSLSFSSKRAVYPLKLSTHQGVFPVRVDIITKEALSKEAFDGAVARGFEVAAGPGAPYRRAKGAPAGVLRSTRHAFESSEAPEALKAELARAKLTGKLHIRTIYAKAFGAGVGKSAQWKEDLAVPASEPSERLDAAPAPAAPAPAAPASAASAKPTLSAVPKMDGNKHQPAAKPSASGSAPAAPPAKGCAVEPQGPTSPWKAAWLLFIGALIVGRRFRARAS